MTFVIIFLRRNLFATIGFVVHGIYHDEKFEGYF